MCQIIHQTFRAQKSLRILSLGRAVSQRVPSWAQFGATIIVQVRKIWITSLDRPRIQVHTSLRYIQPATTACPAQTIHSKRECLLSDLNSSLSSASTTSTAISTVSSTSVSKLCGSFRVCVPRLSFCWRRPKIRVVVHNSNPSSVLYLISMVLHSRKVRISKAIIRSLAMTKYAPNSLSFSTIRKSSSYTKKRTHSKLSIRSWPYFTAGSQA